jgi:tetratricopeptide (TPR) repeat protein
VLAEPCGVVVPSDEAAEDLFERYRREVGLVEPAEDGALRHRPDVRTRMLELLQQDKPGQVEAIHRGAVAYYSTLDTTTARAEEIYHRLQLGQPSMELDKRWIVGVEPYLMGAVEEVPRTARVYLASKLDLAIDPALLGDDVDLRSWEHITAREADNLLQIDQAERALELIRAREERSLGSPLFALEAKALNRLDRRDEARDVIERGIAEASRERQLNVLAELYPLAAEDAELRGDLERAERSWQRAESIAKQQADQTEIQRILAERLRVLRLIQRSDPRETEAVEHELVDRFLISPQERDQVDPLLVKSVVGLLGSEYEDVLKQSLSSVHIQPADPSQYGELATQFSESLATPEGLGEAGSSILLSFARTLGIDVSEGLTGDLAFQILDSAASTGRLEEFLARFLETGESTPGIRQAVADLIDDRPGEA